VGEEGVQEVVCGVKRREENERREEDAEGAKTEELV